MNTIVCNTLSGAISEYNDFDFHDITPTHAGSDSGLFVLNGDTDAGQPIVGTVVTGKQQWGDSLKKAVHLVHFSLIGSGTSELTVTGPSASYAYPFAVRPNGESRSVPGKGIRENYLAFGYRNTDGADFALDKIEITIAESKNRRI